MVVLLLATTARAAPPPKPTAIPGEYGDVNVVSVLGTSDKGGAHGYHEYGVAIVNRSSDRPHRVTLSIPAEPRTYGGDTIIDITRSADVAPGARVRLSLLQPYAPPLQGAGVRVTIDGRRQEESLPLALVNGEPGRYARWTPAGDTQLNGLASRASPSVVVDHMPVDVSPGSGGRMEFEVTRSLAPVAEWPDAWLAYSPYDGIIITPEEFKAAPPGVQAALMQYVETGGDLTVVGDWPAPAAWKSSRTREFDGDQTELRPGFGRCRIVSADRASQPKFKADLVTAWRTVSKSNPSPSQTADLNRQFPVVADAGVPVRGLFFFMIVFAVLIGPVNVFVLGKLKRRMWLLWTVPVISFLTSLGVFGTMLTLEGWSASSRVSGLTLLDEASHRATTVGWIGFYSPLTPGEGLRFGYDTQVVPLAHMETYQGGTARTIDWTTDQHLGTGWVSARVPTFFALKKSEPRRERLTFRRSTDGSMAVVNGLGAGVKSLWYADRDGRLFNGLNIAAGAQATLQPNGTLPKAGGGSVRLENALTDSWLSLAERMAHLSNPRANLKKDSYLAVLDGNPFIEDGLPGVKNRTAAAVVLCLNRGGDGEN